MKAVLKLLLFLLFWVAVALGIGAYQYRAFEHETLDIPEGGFVFEVSAGDGMHSVLRSLSAQGVTRYGWNWRLFTRLNPASIQVGEYQLDPGLTPHSLFAKLSSGDVVQYFFTIVEGWTYRQLVDAILANPMIEADPAQLAPDVVMEQLGAEKEHPEGRFLPETYAVLRGSSALDLLSRSHEAMKQAVEDAWEGRLSNLPLDDPYELLILASIVEKESALAVERPDVAGVFVRRLMQGWRLETDPTVIYGMGESFDGDIRRKDLRTDTPYNTYTRHGLPPTPISLPSRAALEATANPAPGTAMFFVADGTGGHVFSDTLEEHNRAVRAMLERNKKE